MRHASTLLLALAMMGLIACNNSPQKEAEINDSTTPLHLLKPEYNVPYGEVTPDEVKADLERIFAYIDSECPFAILDKDGKEIKDLPKDFLPEGATLQRGAFRIGSYEWGITYQALLAAKAATGDEKYENYVNICMDLMRKAYPLFKQRDAAKEAVEDAQMEQVIHPRALDDCGTMCTAMMKYATQQPEVRKDAPNSPEGNIISIDTLIDNYFRFVEFGQYRLEDRTFARHRPQHNTIWLDDMYMGEP